jgi:hypothetical protein
MATPLSAILQHGWVKLFEELNKNKPWTSL